MSYSLTKYRFQKFIREFRPEPVVGILWSSFVLENNQLFSGKAKFSGKR